jgi:GST-like protein
MASWPWVVPHQRQGQNLDEFPHLRRWFETLRARPQVQKGFGVMREAVMPAGGPDEQARKVLFGQTARSVEKE